ncbi:fatty acid desaturase family protein [Parasphingorhabdus litoris]|uniref:Fatty acid desaturase family protein n=2 Tax=Parasphingorhabdus litoris TaxID=394733 RepID=A0ABN1AWC1_9SPHN
MPAVKAARPTDVFTRDDWARLTTISPSRGLWLILHGWFVAALAAGGTALLWEWHWLAGIIAAPLAIAIVGGRQLGLSILMHEGAHGLLHPNRKINNFAGQWLTGAATGSDLHSYRAYHLTHHKYTQQPEDPDLALSKPFPTTPASMKRKVIRDLTGQTFLKQRGGQLVAAWLGLKAMLRGSPSADGNSKRDTSAGTAFNRSGAAGVSAPVTNLDGAVRTTKTVGRFLLIQLIVLMVSLLTLGIIPFLIWIIALATTFQLVLRIRNIAEHACTTTGSEDPFTHARTTYANLWERTTVAPYWVNYHSEHHLFMGVPCYNLPKAHALLLAEGMDKRMTIASSYRDVLKQVTQPAAT